ncbi:DNA polymerase I [Bordetella hinzii]|uniref:DNA polymerase I n=1 Tax=Bordetella hinzii TaxID=103855 RepID=A0AAN1RXN9_9BORD|nr:DNA polymerase I [Bordetella hinzii]AKQ61259.1 DNA polymerase I [Bordetella hinzii]AZW17750.1 DNA polymerase I [Bordetella hinzii]MBZ0077288.1 DNA polymerase I [Bordetella hinzii]MBZ0081929.1 DNA polymerase I [Bordetella hinzii]MBZ0086201.1 DNA polymerase I [Bordetella hinzii]
MKKTLLLVDGSSYLYRAFHAMPDLRNAQGEPTGALYGVINMLRKLVQDHKAEYAACIFDARGKTFRDDLYPEYKSHRPPMPEDLAAQIEPIHAAVRALGWPVFAVEGVEADDIIATLARRATEEGLQTVVSTGDKDLAQLVNPQVTLVNTMTGEVLDEAGVVNKFGVPAERIVDYLMLVGDAVDNVPGVTKVGPKTAVKWLSEFGSIDRLVEHADTIKGVAGNNLREAVARFPLTRQLLTVKDDCDLGAFLSSPEDLKPREPDRETLGALYDRYGFRTWLRELSGDAERVPTGDARAAEVAHEAPAEQHYQIITEWTDLEAWMARVDAASLVALDTETTSLDEMQARLVGISMAVEPGVACYIPLAHRGPEAGTQLPRHEVLERLRGWLEDPLRPKLLHHAKYDTHVFANEGVALRGVAEDTMLQAYVLESHRGVGLNDLAQRFLGRSGINYEDLCGKGAKQIGFDEVAVDKAGFYAAEDADFTLQLHRALRPRVAADAGLERIYALELEVSRVLVVIERNGVKVDAAELGRQSHDLGREMLSLEQKAYELAGQPFNLNSPKQLGEILFGRMGLPVVRKTAGGAPSTDEEVLSKLAQDYPLPQVLLEYRGLSKLKSTYTDKLPRMINPATGRVHTHYSQAAVITGRLASSDPNLQNIPVRTEAGRRVREAFVAENGGLLLSADYSQIELRIMAHVSDDANLQGAFAAGEDIHRATASEVFGVPLAEVSSEQRRAAKAINFGLIYGMGVFGLASNLGITRDAAQAYIDRYFTRYPGVARYMDDTRRLAREQGYVETVFGRRLQLPDIRAASGPRRQGAERAAINAPMQGTAADLIKLAMVAVQDWLTAENMRARLIMQVHDELVLEAPEAEVEALRLAVPRLMSEVATLRVPLIAEVGVGRNWEQAH